MPIYTDASFISKKFQGAAQDAAPLVFWDGYGLGGKGSGIYVHARSMADALSQLGVAPIVIGDAAACSNFSAAECFRLVDSQLAPKLLKSKLVWPERVGRLLQLNCSKKPAGRPFVLHGLSNINLPSFYLHQSHECAKVLTVHDIIPLLNPAGVSKAYYLQFRFALPRALAVADRVICVSEWARSTLIERYPQYENKIVVIPNGFLGRKIKLEAKAPSKRQPIVLCVARGETYKRIHLLAEIASRAKNKLKVILVTDEKGRTLLKEKVPNLVLNEHFEVRSNVPYSQLIELYSSADVYVHPSLYEGFCLPAAEALEAGLPVVYQQGSGIDEVCGHEVAIPMRREAGVDEWLKYIEDALNMAKEAFFKQKLEKYLVSRVTWQDAALSLKSLYNEVIDSK